jgi:GNAT superfamily N-acetyltransferase
MLEYWHLIEYLGYPVNIEEYKTLLTRMVKRGYTQIVYEKEGETIGLAGFWVNTKLFSGKYIDVDNVIVDPTHRSKGIGSLLMNWIEKHAKDIDAKMIVLDAFVGSTQAHKFYFKENYIVKGFHFAKDI